MKHTSYHKTITVHASAEEVLKKISQVELWWAKKVKGRTQKLNDQFTVDFGETFVEFQISELVPNRKVIWKVTDCNLHWVKNKKEWNGTQVVFEISENNRSTQMDFTHVGLVPEVECYKDCEMGWNEHVGDSLLMFINEGQGRPM